LQQVSYYKFMNEMLDTSAPVWDKSALVFF
jgi:hypothetical protein